MLSSLIYSIDGAWVKGVVGGGGSNCWVVACLPRPMEGMGLLQFSDLFTELPISSQAAGVVGTF